MEVDDVLERARAAKAAGASRFCMGAAWRGPKDRDIPKVAAIVRAVKELGLETCATLGMLGDGHAQALKDAGLDYYNHNIDTAPEFYGEIIHTRDYQDRLETLEQVRDAGLKTCCGGIVGMGETREQRAGLLQALANLPEHPQSVPINQLVPVPGTPLGDAEPLDPFEFVRTIAVARILMPLSIVRLSAGRQQMDDAVQALCFFAGAGSIFYGEKLLTTGNPDVEARPRAVPPARPAAHGSGRASGHRARRAHRKRRCRLRAGLRLQCRGLTCSSDWPSRRPNAPAPICCAGCARSTTPTAHGWKPAAGACCRSAATTTSAWRSTRSWSARSSAQPTRKVSAAPRRT